MRKIYLVVLLIGLLPCSCASLQRTAKTIDTAAVILCDVFFMQQPSAAKLSPEDVEKAFCATAEQVAPFLDSAKKAMGRAGAMRLGESK